MSGSSHVAVPRRRLVFAVVWLVLASLATAALVKLAFFPDRADHAAVTASGQLEAPRVTVTTGSIVNAFDLRGSVVADAGVKVRATDSGVVTVVFVEPGQTIHRGEPLFEVREEVGQTEPEEIGPADPASTAPPEFTKPEPIYAFHTVTAPADGVLVSFSPLVKQLVAIGEEIGEIGPGTFTVTANLTASQQYRMLDEPASASVSIPGGPAPFECSSLQVGAADAEAKPPAGYDPGYDPYTGQSLAQPEQVTGEIRCAVPADQKVFPGLSATVSVVAGQVDDVLTVPVTAVKGDYASGLVYAVGPAGGAPTEVLVELGLTDGIVIEVRSGLADGDEILEYVPSEVPIDDGSGVFEQDFTG